MRRSLCLAVAILAVGTVLSGAAPARAGDPSEVPGAAKVVATVDGPTVVSGDAVVLEAWFLQGADRCYTPDGTGSWSLDGVPLPDTIVSPGAEATPPAGLLAPGDWFLDENVLDATTLAPGAHVLTVSYTDTPCAGGPAYTVSSSVGVTVDNTPPTVAAPPVTLSGTAAGLPLTVTPSRGRIVETDIAGDLVAGGTEVFYGPVTSAPLDLRGAANGPHTLTLTTVDEGGLTGTSTVVVTVANHRAVRLLGPRSAPRGGRLAVQVVLTPVGSRVPVLLQQWTGRRWQQVGRPVNVGTSGRATATLRCLRPGVRTIRAITATGQLSPGASTPVRLRCL